MKKMALLLVMVCVLGGLMVQPSLAAPAWYKCTINGAGVASGGLISLNITDTGGLFTNIFVYEPNTDVDANRNLAVALTAYSVGAQAWVFTSGTAGGTFSQIIISN
jgi:hypothetical protein